MKEPRFPDGRRENDQGHGPIDIDPQVLERMLCEIFNVTEVTDASGNPNGMTSATINLEENENGVLCSVEYANGILYIELGASTTADGKSPLADILQKVEEGAGAGDDTTIDDNGTEKNRNIVRPEMIITRMQAIARMTEEIERRGTYDIFTPKLCRQCQGIDYALYFSRRITPEDLETELRWIKYVFGC